MVPDRPVPATPPPPQPAPAAPVVSPSIWDDLPTVQAHLSSQLNQAAAKRHEVTKASIADEYLTQALQQKVERRTSDSSWARTQITSGIVAIIASSVWFVGGLIGGRFYFYPPLMFASGVIALVNGLGVLTNLRQDSDG